jgi:hypothetical protein
MIYKWDVPSIQCEEGVRQSTLVREIDRPSLVLIDFNIPAFPYVCPLHNTGTDPIEKTEHSYCWSPSR